MVFILDKKFYLEDRNRKLFHPMVYFHPSLYQVFSLFEILVQHKLIIKLARLKELIAENKEHFGEDRGFL